MKCPHCGDSQKSSKNGKHHHQDGKVIQNYLCKECGKRFSKRTGSPISRLRTTVNVVSLTLKMRSEGVGIKASGRVVEKSHVSIMRWEQKIATKAHGVNVFTETSDQTNQEFFKSVAKQHF